jgi:diguanylate cyclase (GGDEF)-like protein/PAS domain S-box-containing protein
MAQHKQVKRITALEEVGSRQHFLTILFVHRSLTDIERCLHELKRVGFTVTCDIVASPEQLADRLQSQCFDLVLAEYASSDWIGTQALDLVLQSEKPIPLIYLMSFSKPETVAELTLKGAYDCVEMSGISHLPVAIHRAQNETALRDARNRAEKDLGRSEAYYRALVGNANYGICRCDRDGKCLEVNEAMVSMLGYASREELLAIDLGQDIVRDPTQWKQLFRHPGKRDLVEPIEIEWNRRDGVILKVRLSGQEVVNDQGDLDAYELIVEDVSKQRELEDHLRRQAASDALTGLANYRRLAQVLSTEIKRCERTKREFALLLFDLDGLKLLNDTYGHIHGNQALCRVADVLSFCSRDIDTAARFGGDEFALVLPETKAEAAKLVAHRIRESVANDGKGPKLSVSVGVAIYPQNGDSIESLLREADAELYAAKPRKVAPQKVKQATAGE